MSKKRFFLTKQATLVSQEITEYTARDSIKNAIRFTGELLEVENRSLLFGFFRQNYATGVVRHFEKDNK